MLCEYGNGINSSQTYWGNNRGIDYGIVWTNDRIKIVWNANARFKHIYFLPTPKANAHKIKELKPPTLASLRKEKPDT